MISFAVFFSTYGASCPAANIYVLLLHVSMVMTPCSIFCSSNSSIVLGGTGQVSDRVQGCTISLSDHFTSPQNCSLSCARHRDALPLVCTQVLYLL